MNDNSPKKEILILVDKKGKIVGQEEKLTVHKKGLLHKGFSIALFNKNQILLQIRKHPFFDGMIDFTASSHPKSINKRMQDEKDAVYECLGREWDIRKKQITNLKSLGHFFYKAKDEEGFFEHELCTIYQAKVERLPKPNSEFAYGYILLDINYLLGNFKSFDLTPWAKKAHPFLRLMNS